MRPTYFEGQKNTFYEEGKPSGSTSSGFNIEPHLAAAVAYLPAVGWIAALFFLFTSKNSFVRFHALQSLIFSFVWYVLAQSIILPAFALSGLPLFPALAHYRLAGYWSLAGTILLLIFAYLSWHKREFTLPLIGQIARSLQRSLP